MPKWKALWRWMEKCLQLFGFLGQKIMHGMKDVQQVEVAPTSSGDVPKNSSDLVAALPEIPKNAEIEEKTPIIMESSSEEIDKKE